MDNKRKNILRASLRVAVAAIAALLAWIGGVLAWIINLFSNAPESEEPPQDAHVVIEHGFLKAKGGDFEGIMEILDDPRNKD